MRSGQKRCSRHGLGSDEDYLSTGQLCHDKAVLSAANGIFWAVYFGLDCSQPNAHKRGKAR